VTFQAIQSSAGKKFYETDPNSTWEVVNNVGLKNHYLCTVYGARLMVAREKGLIVMISSFGGMNYLFNVAYGIGKSAVRESCATLV
jgi:dehydrogenase/reductase SDR family protein 1